jgi:beta-phosphoglucomutase
MVKDRPLSRAFLFDLNGTMIDDMEYHIQAWSGILNEDLKAGLDYAQVKSQMYGKNDELLERVFGARAFSPERMRDLSMEKERRYQAAYRPYLRLIEGLGDFLEMSRQNGIRMAIGSAAIPFNIDFVLDNLGIRPYFSAIVSAEDVQVSKPHPQTYLEAASRLGLLPEECLVFEDAPKGVEAACNAGMDSVVITTLHEPAEFASFDNIRFFIRDYRDPALLGLFPQPAH